ncbi:MAG: patatin-like phospholipase family protein [Hyphomicrobiaceae bacterium]|nr:patatin-like phospholipase family protein [Hyphomicrobiaceae bacterium]
MPRFKATRRRDTATDIARPVGGSGASDRLVAAKRPRIGLALGGGGARGLAHIPILEAFDELGLKPDIIAGTSIGAIFGAAYASGLSGAEIRAHTQEVLTQRFSLLRELFAARAQSVSGLMGLFAGRSALLDPNALLDIVLPRRLARDFSELVIPLKVVATDFYLQEPVVFDKGPVRRAVAASMALPVIFQPVVVDGRALIDGGLANPLPFDLLKEDADIVVAIDVSGAPTPMADRDHPTAFQALFSSAFIFERTIVREKLKSGQPDIFIEGGTSHFQVLDFLKVGEVLAAAEPAKARLKQQLARILASETLPVLAPPVDAPAIAPPARGRRPLLSRIKKGVNTADAE